MANEKRLIDAKEYCKELYEEMNYPGRSEEFMMAIDVAIADLADAPTVDAVEVVRCQNCTGYHPYGKDANGLVTWGKCKKIDMDVDMPANGFCSYGERRDND